MVNISDITIFDYQEIKVEWPWSQTGQMTGVNNLIYEVYNMQNAFQWGNISTSMEQNVIGFTGSVFVYPYYLLPQHLLWKNIDSNAPFSSDG